MVICKTGIFLRLKSRRNLNDFLECRSLAPRWTTFALKEIKFPSLNIEAAAIGAERRDVSWRGKKGFAKSAHPLTIISRDTPRWK